MKNPMETYTVEEVAQALKLHPYTIRRLSREGRIPAFKFGGQWRFRKSEIEAWGVKKNKKY
ncbi:helix-turn-helix domain-containing protein [Patescibacteria group bacterium]|nr:helix-turn-helix domain-containing protein [Patescibacteria group bacterium]